MAVAFILGTTALHFRPPFVDPIKPTMFDPDFMEMQLRAATKEADIIFLGDSLTDRWRFRKQLWDQSFGDLHPANLSVPGSKIAHVLWLVRSGKLNAFHPHFFVVMSGTNDLIEPKFLERRLPSQAEISEGIRLIVESLHDRFPAAKVIVTLAPPEHGMEKSGWQALTIDPFTASDLSADGIHLNDHGYEHWAAALTAALNNMRRVNAP
jgi:lysophospholipase L1-like esterase